jgi:hypothetical protein
VRRFDVVNAPGKGLGRALPAATGRTLLVDAKNRPVPCGAFALPAAAVNDVLSFVGPVEPGLAASVEWSVDGKRRTLSITLASERATDRTVDVLVELDPLESVVESTPAAPAVDVARPGFARLAVPIAARGRAAAKLTLARP